MDNENRSFASGILLRPWIVSLIVFLLIALFFLWSEHEAHLIGALPLLLILGLCLGMHFFMHGSHPGGRHHGDGTPPGRGK